MTATPGYPDWTAPVGFQEHLATLADVTLPQAGGSTGRLDVSQFQSISVAVTLPRGGAGDQYVINAIWSEGSLVTVTDTLNSFSATELLAPAGQTVMVLPVLASNVEVTVASMITSGNIGVVVVGSSRPVPRRRCQGLSSITGPILQNDSGDNVPVGGTAENSYPAVDRAYSFLFRTSSAKPQLDFYVPSFDGIGFELVHVGQYSNVATPFYVPEIVMPFTGFRIKVTNNDTSVMNYSMAVMDVS